MKYKKLGKTGWDVSVICLGTMTFGEQNTQEEGFEQMDYAIDNGVNFFDTAEMYSVPSNPKTYGSTEKIVGNWIADRKIRDKFYLATKVTGPSPNMVHVSDNLGFSKERIEEAVHKSLRNLKTDYIDLYQLHWPERKTNFFGQRGYKHDANDEWEDNFEEALDYLDQLTKEGKIRAWGLSNETPWGVMRTKQIIDAKGYQQAASIQNAYSLLTRLYEVGLAEIGIREEIGLLAYSPLGFGRLTDKFHNGNDKPENRINKYSQMSRYNGDNSLKASKMYYELAQKNGLSLAAMSLAFVNTRDFVASNIIGATNMDQLAENIATGDLTLSKEILKGIEKIHDLIPNTAP